MTKRVFFIGITGCIGGSVFTSIKNAHPDFKFYALVRNPDHANAVRVTGADVIIGSYTDTDIVKQQAEEADIVINCADADNVAFSTALLEGMKNRKECGKGVGILLRTSGTALFVDGTTEGRYNENAKVWNDGDINDMKAITESMFHGQVDVQTLRASERGDLYSYIVVPAGVHGLGSGPVGRVSGLLKFVSAAFIEAGSGFYVGEGSNVMGYIHISDLAALYLLVLNHALENYPPSTTAYERYYIGSSEILPWKTVADIVAKGLHKRGKLPVAEATQTRLDETSIMSRFVSGNALTKEVRGRELGWVPNGPSFVETLEGDMDALFPTTT